MIIIFRPDQARSSSSMKNTDIIFLLHRFFIERILKFTNYNWCGLVNSIDRSIEFCLLAFDESMLFLIRRILFFVKVRCRHHRWSSWSESSNRTKMFHFCLFVSFFKIKKWKKYEMKFEMFPIRKIMFFWVQMNSINQINECLIAIVWNISREKILHFLIFFDFLHFKNFKKKSIFFHRKFDCRILLHHHKHNNYY